MRIQIFLLVLSVFTCFSSSIKKSDYSQYNDVFRIITGNLSKQDRNKLQIEKKSVTPIKSNLSKNYPNTSQENDDNQEVKINSVIINSKSKGNEKSKVKNIRKEKKNNELKSIKNDIFKELITNRKNISFKHNKDEINEDDINEEKNNNKNDIERDDYNDDDNEEDDEEEDEKEKEKENEYDNDDKDDY